jgi:hypothetical protein
MRWILLLLAALIVVAVVAQVQNQGAQWVEVSVHKSWDRKSSGFCQSDSQCLVSNAFNESWDNMPERYWSQSLGSLRPKCIADAQYISDHYCMNGTWSSRTRLVATQLLDVALDQSPEDFALYCDKYSAVLNKYAYSTDYGVVTQFIRGFCAQPGGTRFDSCANNICVVKYNTSVGFGMSINTDISGDDSPLQSLNLSPTICTAALNNDKDFDFCAGNVWYKHDIQSFVYLPGISTLPNPSPLTQQFFLTPFERLKNYVFTVVHNPDVAQLNYTFFSQTPVFNQVYMAKDGIQFAYGFRESNITLSQIDYAGWYFSNMEFPVEACARVVKRYDDRASCEAQPSPTEFFVVAHKVPAIGKFVQPSIVDAWNDMTGKLRVVE